MRYLHTMIRATDLEETLDFFCNKLGLKKDLHFDVPDGRFTLVFLSAPGSPDAQVEITHNWDPEKLGEGRNFGHLAYAVDDIYALCRKLMDAGITINRPPRDGRMAFVRSPDNISIELLQEGDALPPQSATDLCEVAEVPSFEIVKLCAESRAQLKLEHDISRTLIDLRVVRWMS